MNRRNSRYLTLTLSSLLLASCGGGETSNNGDGSSTPIQSVEITTSSLTVNAANIGVPLTNGMGVHMADVPVSVHSEDGRLYVVRWTATPTRQLLDSGVGGMTLAGKDNHLLVVYAHIGSNELRLRESTDAGLTWDTAYALGTLPTGPALPTACIYEQGGLRKRAIVWSAQPSESEGPLMIALHDGHVWQAAVEHTSIPSSGAALYCADNASPEIVWRDHRLFVSGGPVQLYQAVVDPSGGLSDPHPILQPAYDPSLCGYGTSRYTGFHDAINNAYIGRSTDSGATFNAVDADSTAPETQPFDESGKFVSVSCSPNLVAATWGDWPSKQDAAGRAGTRKLGMVLSSDNGQTWITARPASEAEDLGPATVHVKDSTAYVMWSAPGAIHLARVELR